MSFVRPLVEPPRAFARYRQFILCKIVPALPKALKFPVDWRTLQVADAHDPAIWTGADEACTLAAVTGLEVGFVFTKDDPFWFLDVDECRRGNAWNEIAQQLFALLNGAAIEVSHSGAGLHFFGRGTVPPHSTRCGQLGLEFYTEKRFVVLTGTNAVGNADADLTESIGRLVTACFPPKPEVTPADWTTCPVPEWRGPTDDDDLIRRAMAAHGAASVFGGRATFADLWNADAEALGRTYPDSKRAFDASAADGALAQHLAYWTGKDCERIERLMRRSALVRDKWERADYLRQRTILGAVARCTKVCQGMATTVADDGAGPLLKVVDLREMSASPPPPQSWVWDGYLPADEVTLLSGHGGAGKSMIGLMLAVAVVSGAPCLGVSTRRGRVVYFSGEDSAATVYHRLKWIANQSGAAWADIARGLAIIDASDDDPAMFRVSHAGALGEETPIGAAVRDLVERRGVDLLIVDNASDVYDGNEIARRDVRKFMRQLRIAARATKGAVLLLAHVDKQTSRGSKDVGQENYSGSTAWHNSSRSRLFLERSDSGLLTLQHQKATHGRMRPPLVLTWPEHGLPRVIDAADESRAAEGRMRALMPLLREACADGLGIGTSVNGQRAPHQLIEGRRPDVLRNLTATGILALVKQAAHQGWLDLAKIELPGRKTADRWIFTPKGDEICNVAPSAPQVGLGAPVAQGAPSAPSA